MPELTKSYVVETSGRRAHLALAAVLRKLGLIGCVTPTDAGLVCVALAFAQDRQLVAADDGSAFHLGGKVNLDAEIDRDIPF